MTWRYFARRIDTKEMVDLDLPLSNVEVTRTLSGPGSITATIAVEVPRLRGALIPWEVEVWAELDGQIRGGGILVELDAEGDVLRLDVMGISGYPQGMPWMGENFRGVQEDPLNVFRMVWDHLQSQEGGNLGIAVDSTTSPVRIGVEGYYTDQQGAVVPESEAYVPVPPRAADDPRPPAEPRLRSDLTVHEPEPFELNWWSTHDLGDIVNTLTSLAPFDFREETRWVGDDLAHRIAVGYPTLGARREDLRFEVGTNVLVPPPMFADGSTAANEVLALGAGEGIDMLRIPLKRFGSKALRRVHIYTDKSITAPWLLADNANRALDWLDGRLRVTDLIATDHVHAPIGSFDIGDEVFVSGTTGWGDIDRWVRIVEMTILPDSSDRVMLTVREV